MDLRNSSNETHSDAECRAAGAGELTAVAELRGEMAREMGNDFDALSSDWRPKFAAYFGGKQASGNAQAFLACEGHTPIGCAIVSIPDEYRRSVFGLRNAHVNAVYVRPAYRRRGIARTLMQLAIAWARERGCVRVRLRASEDGRLLYEQLGFESGREMELDLGC
jgi:GNAT superfamily N-acetyltransferase